MILRSRVSYPPMSREELIRLAKDLIWRGGVKPRKRLGQHFTVDPMLIEEMVRLAKAYGCSSQTVVEVGTGFGFLTAPLSRVCGRIISIEVDRRIYMVARDILAGFNNIELVLGDAVSLLESIRGYQGVVGSIPYSITSPLLSIMARGAAEWAVLLLQKDVVDRISSPPGTREYGSISVLVNLAFRVKTGNIYPPTSFYPEPEVFSQIIILEKRKGNIVSKDLERFLKCLFSQRKRLAHKAVKKCLGIDISRTETRVFHISPEEIYTIYSKARQTQDQNKNVSQN